MLTKLHPKSRCKRISKGKFRGEVFPILQRSHTIPQPPEQPSLMEVSLRNSERKFQEVAYNAPTHTTLKTPHKAPPQKAVVNESPTPSSKRNVQKESASRSPSPSIKAYNAYNAPTHTTLDTPRGTPLAGRRIQSSIGPPTTSLGESGSTCRKSGFLRDPKILEVIPGMMGGRNVGGKSRCKRSSNPYYTPTKLQKKPL